MELQSFGFINWLVLGTYLCANIVLGFVLSKKVTTADDFFVGQRNIPWWAIGISRVFSPRLVDIACNSTLFRTPKRLGRACRVSTLCGRPNGGRFAGFWKHHLI